MIRRAILKAVAIPGYQVPFASREMPMPYGWGTGGVQVTAAIIGPDDMLKVIDQGADDTTNAVSIRALLRQDRRRRRRPTRTAEATIIQTRHRIPETPLARGPDPRLPGADPRAAALPRAARDRDAQDACARGIRARCTSSSTRTSPATAEIATTYAYPVMVEGRYVMDPSPTPKFDNPKMHMIPALQLFGAGREKRIYAVPPYTSVVSLDFEDHPFDGPELRRALRALRREPASISTRWSSTTAAGGCSSAPTPTTAQRRRERGHVGDGRRRQRALRSDRCEATRRPLLRGRAGSTNITAAGIGCADVSFDLWPGEVLAVVGEVRLGQDDAAQLPLGAARAERRHASATACATAACATSMRCREAERRLLMRTDWGFVHQNPRRRPAHDGIGRRQCRRAADGGRRAPLRPHPRRRRSTGSERVEIAADRIDDQPRHLLGRHAPAPADRPQPRHRSRGSSSWTSRPAASTSRCRRGCSTCCAAWSAELGLAAIIVTHDLARGAPALRPHDGDEGRPRDRDGPDRPGARRSARALHPAARLLDPAGVTTMADRSVLLRRSGLAKTFTMHLRAASAAGARGRRLDVAAGECVVLGGPSGAGKSSILKMVYGNYGCRCAGAILVPHHGGEWSTSRRASPRAGARRSAATASAMSASSCAPSRACRRSTSSPSRCVSRGVERDGRRATRAAALLARLNLPRAAVDLPPATFSGGEQQRVNIARGFIADHPAAAARRADRLARCRQPRGRRRPDRARRRRRAARCSASSTTRRCATRSPTASSTSPPSRRGRAA